MKNHSQVGGQIRGGGVQKLHTKKKSHMYRNPLNQSDLLISRIKTTSQIKIKT